MPFKSGPLWGGLAAESAIGVLGALPCGTQSPGQRQRPSVSFAGNAAGSTGIDGATPATPWRALELLLPRRVNILTIRPRLTGTAPGGSIYSKLRRNLPHHYS